MISREGSLIAPTARCALSWTLCISHNGTPTVEDFDEAWKGTVIVFGTRLEPEMDLQVGVSQRQTTMQVDGTHTREVFCSFRIRPCLRGLDGSTFSTGDISSLGECALISIGSDLMRMLK